MGGKSGYIATAVTAAILGGYLQRNPVRRANFVILIKGGRVVALGG